MQQYDYQKKQLVKVDQYHQKSLQFLYETKLGRTLLKGITRPFVSKIYGAYQDSAFSTRKIHSFVDRYQISMDDYEQCDYPSFNAFFCRKIRPSARTFSSKKEDFCAPCDSKLSIYPIDREQRFQIKHSTYTVSSLLRNPELAMAYEGGTCLVFRLAVDDYHRYHALDAGKEVASYVIPGVLHTVSPISFDHYPVFLENSREVQVFETKHFGQLVQVEVGALMVGRIVHHHRPTFDRGEELGYFQFGGSTVIVLLPPGVVCLEEDLVAHAMYGTEVIVKMGQVLGKRAQ